MAKQSRYRWQGEGRREVAGQLVMRRVAPSVSQAPATAKQVELLKQLFGRRKRPWDPDRVWTAATANREIKRLKRR